MMIAMIACFPGHRDLYAQQTQAVAKQNVPKPVNGNIKSSKSLWVITPAEVNLGIVSYEKSGEATFTLKNKSSKSIQWSTVGPESWKKVGWQKLTRTLENKSDSLRVELRVIPKESFSREDMNKNLSVFTEMLIESGGGKIICVKKISAGSHQEEIQLNSASDQKTISIHFTIAYIQQNPLINVRPLKLDMGSMPPDKTVSKKIILTNSGKETLTWSVATQKHENDDIASILQQGRYLSFQNEAARKSGSYAVPGHLKGILELTGSWLENNGYPSAAEGENIFKVNFSGTGIILYLLSCGKEGNLTVSLDKQVMNRRDLLEDVEDNEGEVLIANKLEDGPHVLTIICKDNHVTLEGIKILGVNTTFFPYNNMKIFPDSGATTRQSNYLTVSLNTGQMFPGFYKDNIVFTSNGGEAVVEVFAEILPENISKVVDIYRYYNGSDYLFTADPQSEIKRLLQNKYLKEGIAFRLFIPDTPGTACFYRWYHPHLKSHFYHYDPKGGNKDLRGYIFEGSIGNIATSKLTNTRELYRWYNAKTGHYFYSTDVHQGDKIDKKSYHFDGIAGYVK